MKIKIRDDAEQAYREEVNRKFNEERIHTEERIARGWETVLATIAGMVVEVETQYLYKDQFKTKPIPPHNKLGYTLPSYLIEYVIGDIRPAYNRCAQCGNKSLKSDPSGRCPHCKSSNLISLGDGTNAEKFVIELLEQKE